MIAIDDVLLSDDIVTKQFVCDLEACKGACCWEGEWGAPLLEEEVLSIKSVWKKVAPYLSEESKRVVKEKGFAEKFGEDEILGTPLLKNGACAYLIWDGKNIGKCAFELAFEEGKTDWPKPISCHLYPIREAKNENYIALNYEPRETLCAPACSLGKKQGVKVYEFLKEPLIRKYGQEFYHVLDEIAKSGSV